MQAIKKKMQASKQESASTQAGETVSMQAGKMRVSKQGNCEKANKGAGKQV